jgi:hypothetical protein
MEERGLDSYRGQGTEIGCCEYGNEISVSKICRILVNKLLLLLFIIIIITFSHKILLRGVSWLVIFGNTVIPYVKPRSLNSRKSEVQNGDDNSNEG